MEKEELIKYLESEGYEHIREIPGRGLCGLRRFIFTYGLCYGLEEWGYEGRFCYTTKLESWVALEVWDGSDNPVGCWIKHKGGGGEYTKEWIEQEMAERAKNNKSA